MTRVFRVRRSNLLAALTVASGATECELPTGLHGGCLDPGHCPQHSGYAPDGEEMTAVRVPNMSGKEFHRRLMAAIESREETAVLNQK